MENLTFERKVSMDMHIQLLEYYKTIMNDHDGIPPRAAISPKRFASLIGWVFIVERRAADVVVPTLIGTHLDRMLGGSFTGKNMYDYYPQEFKLEYSRYLDKVFTHPCGGVSIRNLSNDNMALTSMKTSILPLKNAQGEIRFGIGTFTVPISGNKTKRYGTAQKIQFADSVQVEHFDIGFGLPN